MMSESRPDRRITVEDLLRVKRAERPPADFWTAFERELRTRQLAAAVEKRRWWFALPRVFAGLSRYQMPVGAAAVFAVTFLTIREYREPGIRSVADTPAAAVSVQVDDANARAGEEVVELAVINVTPRPVVHRTNPTPAAPAEEHDFSPTLPWTGLVGAERLDRELSPSERSIAANLAAAEPELTRVLGRVTTLRMGEAAQREPLAQVVSPREQRRQRLFSYDGQLAGYSAADHEAVAPERVASRLDESELYESVRRLSGEGDRLTLKF